MEPLKPPSSRIAWPGLLILAIVLIAAMALASLTRPGPTTARDAGHAQINAIYFADPAQPLLNLAAVRARGVQVAPSIPEVVGSPTMADAIIIDASLFERVDVTWLSAQLRQGRFIVGINVPFSRLEQIPGYRRPQAPINLREEHGGRLFYSSLYQNEEAAGGQWIAYSEVIHSPEGFLSGLLFDIRAARQVCPPTCPSTR